MDGGDGDRNPEHKTGSGMKPARINTIMHIDARKAEDFTNRRAIVWCDGKALRLVPGEKRRHSPGQSDRLRQGLWREFRGKGRECADRCGLVRARSQDRRHLAQTDRSYRPPRRGC
jgi:hypothetical protein